MATSDFSTLIRRLEAATTRLENIAFPGNQQPVPDSHPSLPVSPTASASPFHESDLLPAHIQVFNALEDTQLKKFVDISNKIGGLVSKQASSLTRAFQAERQFLLVASRAKKPDVSSSEYKELFQDLQSELESVTKIKDVALPSDMEKELLCMAECIARALTWIAADSNPVEYADELCKGAKFHEVRHFMKHKEKESIHKNWMESCKHLGNGLLKYIQEYHACGVAWNMKSNVNSSEVLRQIKSNQAQVNAELASPAVGNAPPPPPLPSIENDMPVQSRPLESADGQTNMSMVFGQLNCGESVTKGLKKVDSSEMTHKNPLLRTSSHISERSDSKSIGRSKSPVPPAKKLKPESLRVKKEKKKSRKELEGKKWFLENFDHTSSPVEITTSFNHSVLISGCSNTTFRIHEKFTALSIDNSQRVSLIVDSLVSSIEVINCPNFALQVLGTLPTLLLDRVNIATIYLGAQSLKTKIFTSLCSNVNAYFLPPGEDEDVADYIEAPVPEQIMSYVENGVLVNRVVEHKG